MPRKSHIGDTKASDDADGPRPMRNMRPTQKNPNCVDHFWREHQLEYEARGRETSRVEWVDQHNSGYPKLADELDRRRSTAQCDTNKSSKDVYYCSHSRGPKVSHSQCSGEEDRYNRIRDDKSWHTDSRDTFKNPSSIASVSSYKSFGSLDHEPMVRR